MEARSKAGHLKLIIPAMRILASGMIAIAALCVTGFVTEAIYPEHGLDETALLRNADQAMYEDKAQKRSPETQASAVHSPFQRFFG